MPTFLSCDLRVATMLAVQNPGRKFVFSLGEDLRPESDCEKLLERLEAEVLIRDSEIKIVHDAAAELKASASAFKGFILFRGTFHDSHIRFTVLTNHPALSVRLTNGIIRNVTSQAFRQQVVENSELRVA